MKSFLIQPFGQRIYVTSEPKVFTTRYNSYAEESEKMDLEEIEACRGMAGHLCKAGKGVLFIIYLAPDAEASTLYHEALHMAHYVMKFSGAGINIGSTELQAYLMEHIADFTQRKLA